MIEGGVRYVEDGAVIVFIVLPYLVSSKRQASIVVFVSAMLPCQLE